MPLQIYMPESGVSLAELTDNVNDELQRSGRCIVVVSEGFDVGDLGELKDSFGHNQRKIGAHIDEREQQRDGKDEGRVTGSLLHSHILPALSAVSIASKLVGSVRFSVR